MAGSVAEMPYSWLARIRVSARAAARPMSSPTSPRRKASPRTRRSTRAPGAPSAMRTPSSRVRCPIDIRHHPVDASRRQHQGQAREQSEQHRAQPALGQRSVQQAFHGGDLGEGKAAVQRLQLGPDRRQLRQRSR